ILIFSALTIPCFSVLDLQAVVIYNESPPDVEIKINPYSTVYEGDIIDCNITGGPTIKYWLINGGNEHTIFYGDDPLIFDPEPTPPEDTFVNLTVYAENEYGNDSDTVEIRLKSVFFGDIHWHTPISDGNYGIDSMYSNAIKDNYLDFTACSDHGELIDGINTLFNGYRRFGGVPWWDFIKTIFDKIRGYSEWQTMKEKANEYYDPGNFTTLLGFEWTAAQWSLGGRKWSPNGWDDVGHINFYYKDVYPNAREYSDLQKLNYDTIFKAMADEWDKGHFNIGFPHHPQAKASWVSFTTNWTFLANEMSNTDDRNKILRGAEIYSRWGTGIGQYYTPDVPWLWPYKEDQFYNQTDAWVENALWEWSKMKGQRFVFIASSDTHDYDRPGSALFEESHLAGPSGIVAVYAVHNTREEIWDAMNNCSVYPLHLLKIRANARFDGQMAYGRWINCSSPLEIRITACSTFSGIDHGGKSMFPHGYSPDELSYPISDIWLVKKDSEKGRPWCKVIGHATPDENVTIVTFEDLDVKPNDFYWIIIKQEGEMLSPDNNEYMAFLGPVFINNVTAS
ncbi:MAG: DUF3604 domain-containing protein, partial [Thermoplasmatales archaeon]